MTTTKQSTIEKLKAQENELKARRKKLEAEERQRHKTQQKQVRFLWGEVVAAAIHQGDMNIERWRTLCEQYLKHEKQRQMAIAPLEDIIPSVHSDNAASDSIIPQDEAPKLDTVEPESNKKGFMAFKKNESH